jgi:hypothetical protein
MDMGRSKLNRVPFPSYRVKPETLDSLKETAIKFGYTYGEGAAMGEFLDAISSLDRDLLKLIFKKSSIT